MGNPIIITLSSVGVSDFKNLSWRDQNPFTASLTFATTTMTGDWRVEVTIDDLQLSSNVAWVSISSGTANSSLIQMLAPAAGIRISSTAISSSSFILRVLQGDGGW